MARPSEDQTWNEAASIRLAASRRGLRFKQATSAIERVISPQVNVKNEHGVGHSPALDGGITP